MPVSDRWQWYEPETLNLQIRISQVQFQGILIHFDTMLSGKNKLLKQFLLLKQHGVNCNFKIDGN